MKESSALTAMRHLLLIFFSLIAIYPALNVFSISMRPGAKLRTTDL